MDPHNERVKLLAMALNNLGVAGIVVGIVGWRTTAHAETGFSAATELTGGWILVGTDALESVK
jgi:hypothetical protein